MKLNAQQQKDQPVERELQHSPYFPRMRSCRRIDEARVVRSGVECRADDGQDAADLRGLGGKISGEWGEQREHGEYKRIVDAKAGEAKPQAADEPRDRETD